jgi:hypothetical protein
MALDQTKPSDGRHRWTEAEDRIIYEGFMLGKTQQALSLRCGRNPAAVRRRLVRLGLIDETGRRNIDPPSFDEIVIRHHGGKVPRGDDVDSEGTR